jgi:hypothetical protein
MPQRYDAVVQQQPPVLLKHGANQNTQNRILGELSSIARQALL